MKKGKNILSLLFCMVLLLVEAGTAIQVRASGAVEYDISVGDVTIEADGDYIITGETNTHTIKVEAGVNANITLNNVSVTTASGAAPFTIADNSAGNVTITLKGKNKLTSNVDNHAALQKNGSVGSLTIQGDGSLTAFGGYYAAGIGGSGVGEFGSNITIISGTVTATGGYFGAGIGGGAGESGSNITISGGIVTGNGGGEAAGIGGGYGGFGSNITISGGTVTATGGAGAAGIGDGEYLTDDVTGGNNITISGGIVTATGADGRAGIDGSDTQANWSGLVFQNKEGFIYGDSFKLAKNLTISTGYTLKIKEGQTLTIASGAKLTVAGTVANGGTIIQYGDLEIDGAGSVSGNTPKKKANSISIDKNELSLLVDDTTVLTATVDPKETFDEVVWNCDNEAVLALQADGESVTLIAKKAGKATVTAMAGAFHTTCEVVVDKLAGAASVSVKDIYYGSAPVLKMESTNETKNAVIEYRSLAETNAVYTEETPQKPGSYRVRVTFPETEKYTKAVATADFKITYLPTPKPPYQISGTKGENGFYISPVTVTPAKGYQISRSLDGTYQNTLTYQMSREDAKVYLMNGQEEKTGAVLVDAFKIDTELPVIGAKDKSVCYGDTVEVNVSDANLSRILVNGRAVEFTGASARISLDAKRGREEYQIIATDLAGNKRMVKITVAAAWMKSGVIPNGGTIRLMANQRYMLGSGAWKVSGDTTTYTGAQTFYVGSEGEYVFTKQ